MPCARCTPRCQPDNMYLRFFSLSPGNADREAERVCRAAEPSHVALLACRGSEVVGVATYEMNDDAPTAEVALAVADRFHRHGIATLLLEHLVSIARQRHVRAFTATTLAENFAMLRIFADAGLPVTQAVLWRGRRRDDPAARERRRHDPGRLPGGGRAPREPRGRGEPEAPVHARFGRGRRSQPPPGLGRCPATRQHRVRRIPWPGDPGQPACQLAGGTALRR